MLIVDPTACTVGGAVATLPGTVARRTVTAARLTSATSTLGSAWFSPSNDFLFLSIHSYY